MPSPTTVWIASPDAPAYNCSLAYVDGTVVQTTCEGPQLVLDEQRNPVALLLGRGSHVGTGARGSPRDATGDHVWTSMQPIDP